MNHLSMCYCYDDGTPIVRLCKDMFEWDLQRTTEGARIVNTWTMQDTVALYQDDFTIPSILQYSYAMYNCHVSLHSE